METAILHLRDDYASLENQVVHLIQDADQMKKQYMGLCDENKKLSAEEGVGKANPHNDKIRQFLEINVLDMIDSELQAELKTLHPTHLTQIISEIQTKNNDLERLLDSEKSNISHFEDNLRHILENKKSIQNDYASLETQVLSLIEDADEITKKYELVKDDINRSTTKQIAPNLGSSNENIRQLKSEVHMRTETQLDIELAELQTKRDELGKNLETLRSTNFSLENGMRGAVVQAENS